MDGPIGRRWGGSCDCYDAGWGYHEWSLSSSVLSARVQWTVIRDPISTFRDKVHHNVCPLPCSPAHTLTKWWRPAQWWPAFQEQLGFKFLLKNTWTHVDQTRILGIRGRPSLPPAETACLQNNKGVFLRLLEDDLVDLHILHFLVSCSQPDYFHCWDAETVSSRGSWAFSLP